MGCLYSGWTAAMTALTMGDLPHPGSRSPNGTNAPVVTSAVEVVKSIIRKSGVE